MTDSAKATEAQNPPVKDGEDGRDYRQAYLQEVAQSRKYRQRAQQAEQQLAEIRDRQLTDKQIQEYRQLRSAAEAIEQDRRRLTEMEQALAERAGRDALVRSLRACGVGRGLADQDKILDQAVALLLPGIQVDTGPDGPTIHLADDEQTESPADLQAFVADWLASQAPHFLPPSGDTGSGAHRYPGPLEPTRVEQLDADPARKAKFIAENGPKAYVQLARQQRPETIDKPATQRRNA